MRVLYLTLQKKPFEVMVTGEKPIEVREDTQWIRSRLYYPNGTKKEYDVIHYANGYGKTRPYFICKYQGFYWGDKHNQITYSNGLTVNTCGKAVIMNGEIIETGNLK